jgi:hypothetical protein
MEKEEKKRCEERSISMKEWKNVDGKIFFPNTSRQGSVAEAQVR